MQPKKGNYLAFRNCTDVLQSTLRRLEGEEGSEAHHHAVKLGNAQHTGFNLEKNKDNVTTCDPVRKYQL